MELTEIDNSIQTNTERFKSASWFEDIKNININVIGCGGIGSMTVFYLSRMQPKRIVVFDGDHVDGSNLAGQLFGMTDIGICKPYAIKGFCQNKSCYYKIDNINRYFTVTSNIYEDIVISAVDNMEVRKLIFDKWMSSDSKFLIDGRCSADVYQIFTLSKDDAYNIARYNNEFLFPQEEADETICSYKQTSFITGMIGSMISNIVASLVNNMNPKNPLKIVPFMLEYDSNIMNLKSLI